MRKIQNKNHTPRYHNRRCSLRGNNQEKPRGYAHGCPQKEYTKKEESSPLTVSLDALIRSSVMDTMEGIESNNR